MTVSDYITNTRSVINEDGASAGLKTALDDLYWGARSRLRRLHWLTPNKRAVTVTDTTVYIQQRHVGEYDALRAHHNEEWLAENLLETVTPQDYFWDVGGNIGLYTLLASQQGTRTITWEPWLRNAATIERNLQLNEAPRRTDVIPKALSDTDGRKRFVVDERETPGGGRGSLNTDWQQNATTIVETTRADTAIESFDIPVPDVVKIDVEGAERQVLEGFGDYLDAPRVLYCELHGIDDAAVTSRLRDTGYTITHTPSDTGCGILRASQEPHA